MRYRYRSIKEIPEEHRPREKLRKLGARALSDEELLAVIFGSGTKGVDVMSLSKRVVKHGWQKLEEMDLSELTSIKGLGLVKAMQLKALLELSRRMRGSYGGVKILSPEDAYEFLKKLFDDRKESLIALYLDLSHRVRHTETIAVGALNRVHTSPKEVLRPAVELSVYGVLIAHNHPQGYPEPSQEDILFTERLKRACEILGFELIDHLIVSPEGYVSLREEGHLD